MPEKKSKAKAVRIGVLLTILAVASLQYLRIYLAENWVPDWEAREGAAIVILVPPDPDEDEQEVLKKIREFALDDEGKATFSALNYWFKREYGRYGRSTFAPVYFEIVGPLEVDSFPPAPPRADSNLSFVDRYERTQAFLDYFAAQRERAQFKSKNAVFITFYKPAQAAEFKGIHSVADRRSRSGFVFAPLTEKGSDTALINTAHELLHLYGASDKYTGKTCVYPQGYFAPFQVPRFPQPCAEVMAQGIPVAGGRAETELELFEDMRVGVETAYEIGWISRELRDHYYAGDPSVGPRKLESE